jgi:hypothetical protein
VAEEQPAQLDRVENAANDDSNASIGLETTIPISEIQTGNSTWSAIVEQTTKTCQLLPNMTCISIDITAGPLLSPQQTQQTANGKLFLKYCTAMPHHLIFILR